MKITEKVHALKILFTITVKPGLSIDRFVYLYIILGAKITLIDTAVKGAEETVFSYLAELGRSPEDIEKIILTHAHPDHIGGLKAIKATTGAKVYAHKKAVSWTEDVEKQFAERPVPGFHDLVSGSCGVDETLEDGDVLDLGSGISLEVIFTPGHSSDSTSFFLREEGVLFTGDAIFLPSGIPIYEDVTSAVASINKLKEIEGAVEILSSWDDPKGGKDGKAFMAESLEGLQKLHEMVLSAVESEGEDPMKITQKVVFSLGLPPVIANPLTARSFMANLKVKDKLRII